MQYYLGIDAGSSYIKYVLVDMHENVTGRHILPRGADMNASCREGYRQLLETCQIDESDVKGVAATGYGRKQVGFCNKAITEITALAIGGFSIDRNAAVIIDIGGQDSKIVVMDDAGKVIDFAMNQKCSAGTGKFLEVTSGSLGVTVNELDILSQKADVVLSLSATCTVFAETEIISHIARGEKKENIIKALLVAVAGQIQGLFSQVNPGGSGKILFTGGVSQNQALKKELSIRLNHEIIVPRYSQYVGAYGAALYWKRINENKTNIQEPI
jgi:predicted CoA-substrate-specific enzyme activase